MKPANVRKLNRLKRQTQPPRVPDMTNWTKMQRVQWEVEQRGLQAVVRDSYESNGEPALKEELDAEDARDAAIEAEQKATAAAEALALDPTSLRAERKARETREAADKAAKAAEEARRVAEEAKLRPRPPKPAVEPQATGETPAPATPKPEAEPKPKRERKRRGPGEPKRKKQWWEERAKWQLRGPVDEDERRGRPLYECIHEYDPLTYDDE